MPSKPARKSQTHPVKNGKTPAENTSPVVAPTPAGYWRAPVYGLQWPPPHVADGAVISGVLADLDSCNPWHSPAAPPIPAIVLMVDEPCQAVDPFTGRVVEVPAKGAVRVLDPGFMKFSRLLAEPGKVPHLFVRLSLQRIAPTSPVLVARYVVDVSTHAHNASDYGLDVPPGASSSPAGGASAPS